MTPAQVAQLAKAPAYNREVGGALPLDRWISYAVKVLRDASIETYESCEGGRGHAFPEATVRFHGGRGEGFRALAASLAAGLPVYTLRRFWVIQDSELTGPHWEIVFHPLSRLVDIQREAERTGLMGGPEEPGPRRA
jgi:hypothetical protein